MGAFDWLTQGAQKVGDWFKQNVTPENVSKGASWLNENIVQPGVSIARNIPEAAGYADAIGAGANVLDNLGKKWAGGKANVSDLKDSANQLKGSYDQASKNYGAAKQGVQNKINEVRSKVGAVTQAVQPFLKKRKVQFS